MKRFIVVIFAVLLSGCMQNPYSKFYYDQTGNADFSKLGHKFVVPGEKDKPIIYRSSFDDLENDRIKMLEMGFAPLGYSSFNAGNVNEDDVYAQAKKIHASAIVLYSKYSNTVTGAMPLTLPNNQYSTTNLSGNYNSGGQYGSFSGYANTTTYGTQTTIIPYSVDRFTYGATYWIKVRHITLGLYVKDLDADMRAAIQSNQGVFVEAVGLDTPAFKANFFRGDIVRKVGDADIYTSNDFLKSLGDYAGKEVDIVLLRNKEELVKRVKLNSTPDNWPK